MPCWKPRTSSAIVPYLNIYSYFGRTGEKNADQYPGIDRVTYENLFGGLILEWKFTPEISASVSNFYNNNKIKNITNSIIKPASYEKHSHDLTTGAGLSIDYKYLENICLLGFENKIEWKYGYFKYDYHDISNDLRLYLKPFFFSEFMFRSYVQHISGNYPFYRTPGVEGILSIRGPLSGKRAGKIGFVYNIEHRFVNLIKIPVYLCKLNITPVMFFDSGMAVDKSDQINIKKFYRVIGGGIYLYFTKPVNLPVHIDYGYEPENKKGKLFFYMEGMF